MYILLCELLLLPVTLRHCMLCVLCSVLQVPSEALRPTLLAFSYHSRYSLWLGRGDDRVGNPHRAQISHFGLFKSFVSYWIYTTDCPSSVSSQQSLNQRYPPPPDTRYMILHYVYQLYYIILYYDILYYLSQQYPPPLLATASPSVDRRGEVSARGSISLSLYIFTYIYICNQTAI